MNRTCEYAIERTRIRASNQNTHRKPLYGTFKPPRRQATGNDKRQEPTYDYSNNYK